MKTKKILATVAAFIVAATVLSAAVLATSLPSARPEVIPPAQTQAPANVIAPATTPASAEKQTISEISDAEPVHRHASGDLEWMRAIDEQLRAYRQAEIARLECTHGDSISYSDTDTGITSAYCLSCGVINTLAEIPMEAIVTNAAIRAVCTHEYTAWSYYNSYDHKKMCTKCMSVVYEAHTKVPADCTTFEHCVVCNGRDGSWEYAYGHIMAYVIDWDSLDANGYDDEENYYHLYRCVRDDNDCQYICDYVQVRENCSFTELFWDAESGGEHELYYQCPMCDVPFFIAPEICYYATKGYDCYRCTNPHPGY